MLFRSGPDIITAITNPGLHPSPLLPLARGSSRGTQSTGRVSVGPGHQGRPPPCSLHRLAWGTATVGACQSPGCPEGTEGGKGRLFLSRESGGLGPNFPKFEKSPTPTSLPASPCVLPPARSQWAAGQRAGERGEWGPHLLLGGKAWILGGKKMRGRTQSQERGMVAPDPPHLSKPPPQSPGIASHLPNSSKGTSEHVIPSPLVPGLETLLIPTG